jgi:hypothetical protein
MNTDFAEPLEYNDPEYQEHLLAWIFKEFKREPRATDIRHGILEHKECLEFLKLLMDEINP